MRCEWGGRMRWSTEDSREIVENVLNAPLPAVDSTTLHACVCIVVASIELSVRGVDSTTLCECVQVIIARVELSVGGVDSTTLQGGRVLRTMDIH